MFELIAELQSDNPALSRRFQTLSLLPSMEYVVGTKGSLTLDWDPKISDRHMTIKLVNDHVMLSVCPGVEDTLVSNGELKREVKLAAGDSAACRMTRFTLESTDQGRTIAGNVLDRIQSIDAGRQINVLANLPKALRKSRDIESLYREMLKLALDGIPRAAAACVCRVTDDPDNLRVDVLASQFRDESLRGGFRASRRFVFDTVYNQRAPQVRNRAQGLMYTMTTLTDDVDWAICVPIPSDRLLGMAIYLEGRTTNVDLNGGVYSTRTVQDSDVKFTSILAQFIGSLQLVLELQSELQSVGQFLPRAVLDRMRQGRPDEVFRTTETEVTFLFCDLRNSSRVAEEGQSQDELLRTWTELNDFLAIFTSAVVDNNGIIEDLEGDAVKGFWGWPIPNEDAIADALTAAVRICEGFDRFKKRAHERLKDVSFGIGIATGRAVVGRLGTEDQFKISVFGPVPNLAARLEGMTKKFQTRVLVDGNVHRWLESHRVPSMGGKTRRIARVKPAGMENVVDVCELVLRAPGTGIFQSQTAMDFDQALGHFQAGRWPAARTLLVDIADEENQGPARFLLKYIDEHREPPTGWTGVVRFESK